MLSVKTILKCYLNEGATEPINCILDDNTRAVVKYPNNNQGNLVLINEYLAYKIAEAINISTPSYGLCLLDENSVSSSEFKSQQNSYNIIKKNNYGICFYSSFIPNLIPLRPTFARKISNPDGFQKMIIFDHLIYNRDRHNENVGICLDDMKFYAIDHSHSFKNRLYETTCIWEEKDFMNGIELKDYNSTDILESNKEVYDTMWSTKAFNKKIALEQSYEIQKILTENFIRNIINSLPSSWSEQIKTTDLIALEKYINYRIIHLPDIINVISNH